MMEAVPRLPFRIASIKNTAKEWKNQGIKPLFENVTQLPGCSECVTQALVHQTVPDADISGFLYLCSTFARLKAGLLFANILIEGGRKMIRQKYGPKNAEYEQGREKYAGL